jgi:hypothetical protein
MEVLIIILILIILAFLKIGFEVYSIKKDKRK